MLPRASKPKIDRHWEVLCEQIGHRTAGTEGESQAADYIEKELHRLGMDQVERQEFEFPNASSSGCTLKVSKTGGKRATRPVRSVRPRTYGSSTPGKSVRGPLAYLQSGLPLDFKQPLKGKIGLLIGAFALADKRVQRRAMQSGLKALLCVDMRVPFAWPTSIGAAPQWMDGFTMPSAGISYLDAIELVEQLPLQAELAIRSKFFPSVSQNIIAEIKGSQHPDEVIVVSGHHDCVEENVGADDNGSGVIFVLELARIFAKSRPRRTIRLVSYGVEERLSVGSYLYMRSLTKRQHRQIKFVINADSISSTVGTDVLRVTGTPPMEELARRVWKSQQHPAEISAKVHAYSDHFPLNIVGTPSISLGRPGIEGGGCWQLHSPHDTVEHVSAAVLARNIDTSAEFIKRVANAKKLPFARRIEPKLAHEVATIARDVYYHPWSPERFNYDR
jgi:hypothetical protein